jgi:hypothetical protein
MSNPMDTGITTFRVKVRIPIGVSAGGFTDRRARQERASVCPVFPTG